MSPPLGATAVGAVAAVSEARRDSTTRFSQTTMMTLDASSSGLIRSPPDGAIVSRRERTKGHNTPKPWIGAIAAAVGSSEE